MSPAKCMASVLEISRRSSLKPSAVSDGGHQEQEAVNSMSENDAAAECVVQDKPVCGDRLLRFVCFFVLSLTVSKDISLDFCMPPSGNTFSYIHPRVHLQSFRATVFFSNKLAPDLAKV